ncbi:MAG: HEAT repeat domain-containing protein, partial [Leptonema sp. (in: bacteria)]
LPHLLFTKEKEKKLSQEEFISLTNKIKYLNTTERLYAIKSLEKLTEEDKKRFYDLLADISLNDFDVVVKEKALAFLADEKANCEKCIESYKKNLFDEEEKVQLQALKGIENLQLKNLNEEIKEVLKKTDFKKNNLFANALLRTIGNLEYNQKEISEILLEKFKDEETDKELKRTIILYAGSSRNMDFKDLLLQIINEKDDEDVILKAYAVNSLGKLAQDIDKTEITEKLKKMYNDILSVNSPKERTKYNPLKQQIILALIRLGDDSIKEELKKMALDDDANVRLKALEYIEDLQLKDFKDLVEVKYKYDPSKSVKNKAKDILQKWGELKQK